MIDPPPAPPLPIPSPHGSRRIAGLTVWRALLMLGGLPLHAVTDRQDYAPFAAINLVSASFRMGAFFMISGLLGGFALMRRPDPSQWLRRRLVQLGCPALVGLAVISPVIGYAKGVAHPYWPIDPYHIWFLVALLAYTGIAFAVHRIDRDRGIFARIEQRSRRARRLQVALLLLVGLLCFTLMIVGGAIGASAPPAFAPIAVRLPLILGYAPIFLLGLAAARAPTLWRVLIASRRMPLTMLGLALAIQLVLRSPWLSSVKGGPWDEWADLAGLVGTAWCPLAATILILRSAMAIRRVPPLLDRLAGASFTMYMLHYPIIVATKMLVGPLGWNVWAEFWVAIGVGGGLSYAVHRWIVAPVPILALLIAGRPLPTAPADEGEHAATSDRSSTLAGGELLLPGAPSLR